MTKQSDISIVVTGSDSMGRALVTNVMAEALEEVGFTDVNIVNAAGEPTDKEEVTSILDLVKATSPTLFEQSISILGKPAPGSVEEIADEEGTNDPDIVAANDNLLADVVANDGDEAAA